MFSHLGHLPDDRDGVIDILQHLPLDCELHGLILLIRFWPGHPVDPSFGGGGNLPHH